MAAVGLKPSSTCKKKGSPARVGFGAFQLLYFYALGGFDITCNLKAESHF